MGQDIPEGSEDGPNISPIEIAGRVRHLTEREWEVMKEVVSGASSKQTVEKLGMSLRTLEVHRARVIQKIGARSTTHLIRLMTLAGY